MKKLAAEPRRESAKRAAARGMLYTWNRIVLLGIVSVAMLLAAAGHMARARRSNDAAARRKEWRTAWALLITGMLLGLTAGAFLVSWDRLSR